MIRARMTGRMSMWFDLITDRRRGKLVTFVTSPFKMVLLYCHLQYQMGCYPFIAEVYGSS